MYDPVEYEKYLERRKQRLNSLAKGSDTYPEDKNALWVEEYYHKNADVLYESERDSAWICKKDDKYFIVEQWDNDYKVYEALELDDYWEQKKTRSDDAFVFSYDNIHKATYHTYGRMVDGKAEHYMEQYPRIEELEPEQLKAGMRCTYNGVTMEYIDHENVHIEKDYGDHTVSRTMKVKEKDDFVYDFKLKKSIGSTKGADSLFAFFDQIAQESRYEKYPLFSSAYKQLENQYLKDDIVR